MKDAINNIMKLRELVQKELCVLNPEDSQMWSEESVRAIDAGQLPDMSYVRAIINTENPETDSPENVLIRDIKNFVNREREIIQFLNDEDLPKPQNREIKIQEFLENAWDKGFTYFFSVLKSLNISRFPVTEENLVLPIELDFEIYTTAIRFVQSKDNFEDWITFVDDNSNELLPKYDFKGAGLPTISDKVQNYVDRIKEFLDGHNNSFGLLLPTFKKMVSEIWGENYHAFFTNGGATDAALRFSNAYWQEHPNAQMIHSNHDYTPMFNGVSDQNQHQIDIDLKSETEESWAEKILNEKKKILVQNSHLADEPFAVFLNSEFRQGIWQVDVHKIVKILRQKDPNLHIWVDAAQDNRFFADHSDSSNPDRNPDQNSDFDIGDVVFCSKRKQLTLINQNRYPEESNIGYALAERCGGRLAETDLMQLLANLLFEKHKIAHTTTHLTGNSALWRYSGKQKYLDGQVDTAEDYFEQSEILSRHFEFHRERLADENYEWKVARILNISQTSESEINIWEILKNLEKQGMGKIDCFDLNDANLSGELSLDSIDFDANYLTFLDQVRAFQKYHLGNISVSLLPEDLSDETFTKDWTRQKIAEHKLFRLFLTVEHLPAEITNFLKALESEISTLEK